MTKRARKPLAYVLAGVAACLVTALSCEAGDQLQVGFNATGLASLTWSETALLETGAPDVQRITLETKTREPDGRDTYTYEQAPLEAAKTSFDATTRTLTHAYAWGDLSLQYEPGPDRLGIAATITNRTEKPVVDFSLRPITLKFPSVPSNWEKPQPRVERSLDQVVAVRAQFGEQRVWACLDSIYPPMALGFGKPLDEEKLVYKVEWNGGVPVSDPDAPRVHHLGLTRVEPGKSTTFRMSLRFGPAAAATAEVVADLNEQFRARYPFANAWEDRRPIGMLMLICGDKSETNPRGWFKKPDLAVATPEGKAEFRKLLMDYADRAIASMQAFDAQGGIVWNVEGEENPHPITYIGDPRMLKIMAPEMDEVADDFFKRFTDAGFRTGICIRPTQLYKKDGETWAHGTGSHGPDRNPLNDDFSALQPDGSPWWTFFPVVERMCRKIEYAKERWGCTIFYVDTNGIHVPQEEEQAFRWLLLTGDMWKAIKAKHPDILIIPELPRDQLTHHATNWAYGAQYMELDLEGYGTPNHIRELYPQAFSLVNIADGPIEEKYELLLQAVKNGDILMTRGWFGDHRNQIVKALYHEAKTGERLPGPEK